jgi:proteasomal ATPase-associated factor 1
MRVGSSVFHSTSSEAETHGALSAISSHSGNLFATGSTKGVVGLYDVRFLSSPSFSSLVTFRRNEAGIEDLCFMNLDNDELGLAIATSDGLPFVAEVSSGGSQVKVGAELAGVDCDSVRAVRTRGRDVWCASDDAIVRKWSL